MQVPGEPIFVTLEMYTAVSTVVTQTREPTPFDLPNAKVNCAGSVTVQ